MSNHALGTTTVTQVGIVVRDIEAKVRAWADILNLPVPHEGRTTGTVSIVKWKLWKAAAKSFWQALRCRRAMRRAPKT